VAIGDGAQAAGGRAVSIGAGNIATGNGAVAIGDPNIATGQGAVAMGNNNSAIGQGAVAIGNQNSAGGQGSIALGNNNVADMAGSVAIGDGVTTTRVGQVSVGNAASTVTLSGIVSSASRAAQSGALRLITSDGLGNLATSTLDVGTLAGLDGRTTSLENRATSLEGRTGMLENRTASLESRTATLTRQARQTEGGIAAALALGGTMMPADMKVAMSFNLATYRGEQGFSAAAVAKVTERVYVSGGVAGSTVKGSTGGRVGVTFGW
jgi:hypothetical protein